MTKLLVIRGLEVIYKIPLPRLTTDNTDKDFKNLNHINIGVETIWHTVSKVC